MGKKKKQSRPSWEIDWNRVKSWDDLIHTIKHDFKLILESPVGNEVEDDINDADGGITGVPNDNLASQQEI